MKSRKKAAEGHVNHERWMVSYADFVTLLFAVFVVLFASAQSNKGSPQQIASAVAHALRNGSLSEAVRVMRAASPEPASAEAKPGAKQAELTKSLEVLNKTLSNEITTGKVEVRLDSRGLVVSLRQAAFFPSGQAVIESNTYPIVDKLAQVLSSLPNMVRLEGHTDAIPISNSKYASNWELSAGRSIAMLELLAERGKIARSRMSIAGFAETEPIGSNQDAEGRARNRRVDVVILDDPKKPPATP